jgi:hypothetical protein
MTDDHKGSHIEGWYQVAAAVIGGIFLLVVSWLSLKWSLKPDTPTAPQTQQEGPANPPAEPIAPTPQTSSEPKLEFNRLMSFRRA